MPNLNYDYQLHIVPSLERTTLTLRFKDITEEKQRLIAISLCRDAKLKTVRRLTSAQALKGLHLTNPIIAWNFGDRLGRTTMFDSWMKGNLERLLYHLFVRRENEDSRRIIVGIIETPYFMRRERIGLS